MIVIIDSLTNFKCVTSDTGNEGQRNLEQTINIIQ